MKEYSSQSEKRGSSNHFERKRILPLPLFVDTALAKNWSSSSLGWCGPYCINSQRSSSVKCSLVSVAAGSRSNVINDDELDVKQLGDFNGAIIRRDFIDDGRMEARLSTDVTKESTIDSKSTWYRSINDGLVVVDANLSLLSISPRTMDDSLLINGESN